MFLTATRRHLLALGGATLGAGVLGGRLDAADPLKVGFVYVGPIGDHGWTYRHDLGR